MKTEKLLTALNAYRGKVYPDIGYSYFADIKGDGRNIRSIWTINNDKGGVTYSDLNGRNPRERCARIRAAIRQEESKALQSATIVRV
jgi:hypothetical protein